jgi:hypothetical protein
LRLRISYSNFLRVSFNLLITGKLPEKAMDAM